MNINKIPKVILTQFFISFEIRNTNPPTKWINKNDKNTMIAIKKPDKFLLVSNNINQIKNNKYNTERDNKITPNTFFFFSVMLLFANIIIPKTKSNNNAKKNNIIIKVLFFFCKCFFSRLFS